MSKRLAYVNIWTSDEIMEEAEAERLPQLGETVRFGTGEAKGAWSVCGLKPVQEAAVYDALVFLDKAK